MERRPHIWLSNGCPITICKIPCFLLHRNIRNSKHLPLYHWPNRNRHRGISARSYSSDKIYRKTPPGYSLWKRLRFPSSKLSFGLRNSSYNKACFHKPSNNLYHINVHDSRHIIHINDNRKRKSQLETWPGVDLILHAFSHCRMDFLVDKQQMPSLKTIVYKV